ncbi:restriction endonuclease [Streptomyces sp. YU58]|uniref:restriction endonuclease n=1 Tax=Streptomyces sp. SX92 TaxID=3158972 RepID=UPI0027B96B61|nr:restriction endonuclease [Streptomyces coralus]WLW56259.1 restriction endonuclease [Streptomyces coralus]
MHRLGACGLAKRVDRKTVQLTDAAQLWLETNDDELLMATLHAHVRFVGEILSVLKDGDLSHDELRSLANERFGLGWSSLDQLRRRTNWLRCAALIELRFDKKLTLTQAGRDFLPSIEVADASKLPHSQQADQTRVVDVSKASETTQSLLNDLDELHLKARKSTIGFIPKGTNGDAIASLQALVSCTIPSVSRKDFYNFCQTEFGSKESSTSATLSMLRGTGLVEQIGLDTFAATEQARAWVDSSENVELARILHANILFFGEVLDSLADSDRAPSLASYASQMYGMPREDVAGIRSRLQILRGCGLIEEISYARFRITPLGEAFKETIPLLPPEVGRSIEFSAAQNESRALPKEESLALELLSASKDSANPSRFENSIAAAFEYLGLDARRDGSPGNTDVIITIPFGQTKMKLIIVDAKSSASGLIREQQVDFDTLREHKKKHEADQVAIVGPSFAEDRIKKRAAEHGVALISAEFLADVLRRQSDTPLAPHELVGLFDPKQQDRLKTPWGRASGEASLLTHVVNLLIRESSEADTFLGGGLSVEHIYLILRGEMESKPDPQEIEKVLTLLSSPLIRAVSQKGKNYFSLESANVTALRLESLAQALRQVSMMLE